MSLETIQQLSCFQGASPLMLYNYHPWIALDQVDSETPCLRSFSWRSVDTSEV